MKQFVLIIALGVLFSSCRNGDETPPTITVDSPANMSTVAFGDVITVSGRATDEEALKSVKIELLYDNLAATDFSFEIIVNNDAYDFTKSFQLDDRHLPSATYLLKVSAIDKAGNRDAQFIELNYGELPQELLGIAMVDKASSSVYDLYFYDLNTVNFISSFTGNFQSLLADSYHLLIWLAGGSAGNLITYDLENDVVNWAQTPQLSFYPYFGNLHQMESDHNIAMVRGNSTAVTMDDEGIVNRTYSLNTSAEGGEIIEIEGYVIIEEIIGGSHYLSTFVKSTGSKVHQLLFNEDIIALKRRNKDEVFVITSENNACHFYQFDYLNNSTYEPHSIDPGSLFDLCVIDSDEVLLAHSGGLLRFTLGNNSMVNVSPDIATQLIYDHLSGIIYANVNNTIKLFDHLGNSGGNITTGINVTSFALYYNK
ncbi:DUF4625 domain-containing protein [Parvicella tangerina]|uniref:Uncharacterized protein n=1 Tax=Parvicella tangerina TaxID=2829795 RepID=A0A916JMS3_9FLAO|nr:DUF4625 domain-containing protein [Parvicella tangerina]CAG5080862.1 hypothetical protein CRYO30217_01464 [Parvicella tangerina]